MRRYSRYKICKTSFHFFFYSSRILNFNRPKWSLLKEKIESFKKTKKQKLQKSFKTRYSRVVLQYFFNVPFLFKSIKNYKKKNKNLEVFNEKYKLRDAVFLRLKTEVSTINFDYLFLK